uniref:Uncharacterized protein n=1 Tax=Kalmanozyma brasiliensis (strain GHG001) TaxID=1365824 RepID=V5F1V1_KALBG
MGLAFFDGLSSRGSTSTSFDNPRTVEDLGDFGFEARQSSFNFIGADDGDLHDDEDIKDLDALDFSRTIRMNLEALSRSSADPYAYTHGGYLDPNASYDDKRSNALVEPTWMESNYAELISRLAVAHEEAEHYHHDVGHLEPPSVPFARDQEGSEAGTPLAISSKDSSLATSLTSARSSSEVLDDEIRTPPESAFDTLEASSMRQQHRVASPSTALESAIQQHTPTPANAPVPSAPSHDAAVEASTVAAQISPSFHLYQARAALSRKSSDSPVANDSCAIEDEAELEVLSDDIDTQRRAAGKAKMLHASEHSRSNSQSERGHHRRTSSVHSATLENNKPFARLGPQDIAFSASTLPERTPSSDDCVDMVVSCYPAICDAPSRQFGEDGLPLPPTKKDETSEEERQARKEALKVKFCAKQRLSLIKAVVVMESRSAHWKRLGPFNPNNIKDTASSSGHSQRSASPPRPGQVGQLPVMPSPWSLEIRHEQLDIAQIKGKSKKTIELASLRTNAQCVKCEGSGLGACTTCKAEQADECFWCNGTGREKTRAQSSCRRCQGAGVLKCNTCSGSLKSACRSCEGTGTGEYGFLVDVTVKRVDMPAVPLATLFPQSAAASSEFEPSYDEVRAAAKLALWDSINKLTDARALATASKGGKAKTKDMIPVMAACMWENSTTHVVSVDVPLAAKFKKGATPSLRPEGLHRKIATQRRFFTVPTDEDLRPIEMSEDEVKELGAPASSKPAATTPQVSPSKTPPRPRSAVTSTSTSPSASSSDLSGSPPLGTPVCGGGVSGYSTPTRVPSPQNEVSLSKPAAKEFVMRPSPLSQLAAATTPSQTVVQPTAEEHNYFTAHSNRSSTSQSGRRSASDIGASPQDQTTAVKAKRSSAGQLLTKTFGFNKLSKRESA